jgi:hypothetical protein
MTSSLTYLSVILAWFVISLVWFLPGVL